MKRLRWPHGSQARSSHASGVPNSRAVANA